MNEHMITVRVSPELHQRLKVAADASRTSLNKFCVAALQVELGEKLRVIHGTQDESDDSIVVDVDTNGNPAAHQMDLVLAIAAYLESVGIVRVIPRQFNAIIRAANSIIDELCKPEVLSAPGIGLDAWLESDDTGISSEFMAGMLSGKFCRKYGHPMDAGDFGRCVRLLDACPELRPKLEKIESASQHWNVLVENWSELESLYRGFRGATLHSRMTDLYAPIDKGIAS